MKIVPSTGYFHLYPDEADTIDTSMYLGSRVPRGCDHIIVEDNMCNRILLGMPARLKDRPVDGIDVSGLKDYQINDVHKMVALGNVLNRNPMGLGKTVETIVTLREAHVRNAMIVAPKIVLAQWAEQFKKWWPEKAKDVVVYENGVHVFDNNIAIINYEKLINRSTLTKFKLFRWDAVVVDEAHRIKNANSQRTKAVKSIPARDHIALTGTPILNKPDDLWSILHFINPDYSGKSFWTFQNHFCNMVDGFFGRENKGLTTNPARIALLNTLMEKVSVYNTVNVAKGKTHEIVKLPMGKEQKKLYKDMKDLVLDELPPGATIANGAVLTIRLAQTTSWPGLFIPETPGPKFEWILDMCQDNPSEKLLVFTRFAQSAEALKNFLGGNDINTVTLTGQLSDKVRAINLKAFLEDKHVQVLVGTIGAMGQGTDGLQKVCHTCIFLDRDWSPEIMSQAEDRLNRWGQEQLVNVYILECEHSFDQHIGKINMTKANDIREALGND